MATKEVNVVFNFYEKITPPPNMESFLKGWSHLGHFVKTLDHFVSAQLHTNLNPEGRFPYVNYSFFEGTQERITKDFCEPSPELIKALVEGHGPPGLQVNYPGGYTEVATMEGSPIAPALPKSTDSVFLLSSFKGPKTDEESAKFESEWMDVTGVTKLKADESLGLQNAALYRRFTQAPYDVLMYVVRCEFVGIGSSRGLEIANDLKDGIVGDGVERTNSSLYKIEPSNILSK
ncbi:uncharacterized protein LOC117114337 [Anneissia japonica]|uniref:uncharacterized protein LOC117114337 n=1 Tax=Anneissia japonica TaxID=1529436 RepID=UPI001425678A|nr:uncharacterized protein LOC117114337 [Anneissia japonica]